MDRFGFKWIQGSKSCNAPRKKEADWQAYQPLVCQLYGEGKTINEIREAVLKEAKARQSPFAPR